jgi:hypothetical protein
MSLQVPQLSHALHWSGVDIAPSKNDCWPSTVE